MTSITNGSNYEVAEREALKEHLADLLIRNKKLCERIETLEAAARCVNKSKEYVFEDLRKLRGGLAPVISWLDNGCDPKEAANEIRLLLKELK
jgi:hypothetical protein